MSPPPPPSWYPEADGPATARAAADLFAATFGGRPDGVWSAPGRVNVIGEHVDYAGGLVLPFALAHRTSVALRRRDDDQVHLVTGQSPRAWRGAVDRLGPGHDQGWAAYVTGVAWALAGPAGLVGDRSRRAPGGFEAAVEGRVPLGAGLSSSAALETATALALDDAWGLGLAADDDGRARLAAACVRAENEVAGAPTGGMDQTVALRARPGHALLVDCRGFSVRHLPWAVGERELLVIDTRAHHTLTDGQYGSRRLEVEAAVRRLGVPSLREVADAGTPLTDLPGWADLDTTLRRRVRHVVGEIDRVKQAVAALGARSGAAGPSGGRTRSDHGSLGALLDASHASLGEEFEVSCPELDVACAVARTAGAEGARMTGGGFGGSAIALVPRDGVAQVASAVAAAFERRSWATPRFLIARPSAPAGRDS